MKRIALALLIVAGFGPRAVADDAARIAVLDQLQAQFSVCAAFYAIELSCIDGRDALRRLAAVSRRADALAEAIWMTKGEAALRLELNLATERSLMQEDCRGLSTLRDRYDVECDPLSSGRE